MSQVEIPRYRCAAEKGFFAQPTEIAFAKLDYRVGIGQRAEEGDEFDFEGPPGAWMEPLNEAAIEEVKKQIALKRRRGVAPDLAVVNTPVQPPKNAGLRGLTDGDAFEPIRDARSDERIPEGLKRAAPRRRAAAK